jgi:hypothetical protein
MTRLGSGPRNKHTLVIDCLSENCLLRTAYEEVQLPRRKSMISQLQLQGVEIVGRGTESILLEERLVHVHVRPGTIRDEHASNRV